MRFPKILLFSLCSLIHLTNIFAQYNTEAYTSLAISGEEISNNLLDNPLENKTEEITTQISPNSYWAGASLGYNFKGEDSDNIVGSGVIKLNAIEENFNKFDFLIIGNLAKVASSIGENPSDDIAEIVQSNQGLSIGVAPIWVLNKKDEAPIACRLYMNLSYKLNGFQDVGEEEETVNLEQGRFSTGIEFEGLKTLADSPLNFSSEFIYTTFNEDNYNKVFGEKKSSILAWENSLIIPISKRMGIVLKHTVSSENVFQAGIIIKKPKIEE